MPPNITLSGYCTCKGRPTYKRQETNKPLIQNC